MRNGRAGEKRSIFSEPAGYELREEPHALCLACLPLCENPERSVYMQVGARHPHQQGVGISDEARQCRDPEPLAYSCNLRPGVRDPERNLRGTNLTLAGPIRNAVQARPSVGKGKSVSGRVTIGGGRIIKKTN